MKGKVSHARGKQVNTVIFGENTVIFRGTISNSVANANFGEYSYILCHYSHIVGQYRVIVGTNTVIFRANTVIFRANRVIVVENTVIYRAKQSYLGYRVLFGQYIHIRVIFMEKCSCGSNGHVPKLFH